MSPRIPTGPQPALRVRLEQAEGIARVTLNRPHKKNALDPEGIRQLRAAFDIAARDDTVRVVILAGDGDDFCAGADIDSLAELVDADVEVQRADAQAFADLLVEMRRLPKPIIAKLCGRALAGGAGLVTACDVVMAAADSQLGYPEVKIGFVPAVVMALLRRTVNEKTAFDLTATGRAVGAEEALRLGLITRVVAAAELDTAVETMAREFVALPAAAVAQTKALLYDIDTLPLDEALKRGIEANVAARRTQAFRDGVARFLAAHGKRDAPESTRE